ncbi:PVC-type heme-binding CxxCH protein [Haloferula chungangensis]|uniref:PVC-type heme-binding CxxCH protein n=1 Tax=Haloferula chungangensis TaxID=1048331 RepID=A0ABW2LBT3_9BACT
MNPICSFAKASAIAWTLFAGASVVHAQLPLQKSDTICLIGNGLGDRMQHDGWVETVIQSELPDHQLHFRNLAHSGDTVSSRPRSKDFMADVQYLTHCKADVLFVFFGYNESFAGEKGVPGFKKDLGGMIDEYRGLKFNGESAPRFVLFSPIAHEDLKDPNLPDGTANNRNLALYTQAIAEVAEQKDVAFVDLFNPSRELYAEAKSPLTLNGVHLLPEGNKQLAWVIAYGLTGTPPTISKSLEPVRQAVLDKNWHWHCRYRATDGNDIWGSRSKLAFVDGQTNGEVLQHELKMLDVLTANRDPAIWAAAKGSSYKIDDSNVPPPVPVVSNVGGGSRSSKPEKEGSEKYLGGEEAIEKIKVPKGFKVNLFADEESIPGLINPVQMQVDTKGRLWAACWSTYPMWEPMKKMTDSILILPDDDGDGKADRAIEFAKVHNPVGFEFWNGGVIVTSQPDVLFLKDTDGDDVADVRVVLLQGIGSADTHHSANNLIYGPDGAIYWQSGVFLRNAYEHPWGPALKTGNSAMYRFDPRRYTISLHAMNSPNPHGTSFDYWGYQFANDGTGGRSYQVRPHGDGFKMFPLVDKEVRPVTSDAIISSSNFPEEIQQDFLLMNVIGYLGAKRYDLHREGFKKGKINYKLGEIWGTPTDDFFRSADKNFRPTDAVFGADGALYISDWHNIIIGHMQHNIRDPKRDKQHGRIYRMVYEDRPLQKNVAIDGLPISQLLRNLEHPIDDVRHRTRVELSERNTAEVISAVSEWVKTFDPKKDEHAHHLLEALWVHQQHNVKNEDLLQVVLDSPNPHARIAAATVKHLWGPADPAKAGEAPPEEEDETPRVRKPKHLNKEDGRTYAKGAEVYHRDAHCVTCHQPNGEGLAPAYPPLAGSEWVQGSDERLIKLTLHGLWGPITVKGKHYGPEGGVPPMTRFAELLNDEEVAAVLTYVRNSWGNEGPAVQPDAVEKVRAAHSKRNTFWSPEELLKDHPMETAK